MINTAFNDNIAKSNTIETFITFVMSRTNHGRLALACLFQYVVGQRARRELHRRSEDQEHRGFPPCGNQFRARVMFATEDEGGTGGDAVSEAWEPLSVVDAVILALVGTLQGLALLICVHLIRWRKWPPYVTKNVTLVVISTVSGVLWTVAVYLNTGFIRRQEGDILAACDFMVGGWYYHAFAPSD